MFSQCDSLFYLGSMILLRRLAPSLRSYRRLQRLLKRRQLLLHLEVRLPLCLLLLPLPPLLRQARRRLLNHLPRLCYHRLLHQSRHHHLLLLLPSLPRSPLHHHPLLNHHLLPPTLSNQLRQLHLFHLNRWHLILQHQLLLSPTTLHLHFRHLIQVLKGPTLPLQLRPVTALMALSRPVLRLPIPLLRVVAASYRRHHQPGETITTLVVEVQKLVVVQ